MEDAGPVAGAPAIFLSLQIFDCAPPAERQIRQSQSMINYLVHRLRQTAQPHIDLDLEIGVIILEYHPHIIGVLRCEFTLATVYNNIMQVLLAFQKGDIVFGRYPGVDDHRLFLF